MDLLLHVVQFILLHLLVIFLWGGGGGEVGQEEEDIVDLSHGTDVRLGLITSLSLVEEGRTPNTLHASSLYHLNHLGLFLFSFCFFDLILPYMHSILGFY